MIQRSIEVSPHIMPHSDKSEDPDLKANKSMHAHTHTHTHTHIIKQCLVSALAQPRECVEWLQYTARLTAHMDAISVKTDRRCCNDALMMPQNLLLGSAPDLMLFSCVPCLHNVLQYIKTVLSQQGVMLSACHEVLLFNAGWPCPMSMQPRAALHHEFSLAHGASQAYVCAIPTWNISQSHQRELTQTRTDTDEGNSLVKYGHNSLQVGAYLLGNRVVLLNICHHLLCYWPLLCSASECSQSIMAFCIERSNHDAALTQHVGKQATLHCAAKPMRKAKRQQCQVM